MDQSGGSGGGLYNGNSNPKLTDITFGDNWAANGGGMFNSEFSNPIMNNVVFGGNSADEGGGIYNSQSSPTINNATFSGNTASGTYGIGGECTIISIPHRLFQIQLFEVIGPIAIAAKSIIPIARAFRGLRTAIFAIAVEVVSVGWPRSALTEAATSMTIPVSMDAHCGRRPGRRSFVR